jgi:hypothetical protein
VKNLPEEFRASHSEVDWRSIARMREPLHSRLLWGGLSARMGCSAREDCRTKT